MSRVLHVSIDNEKKLQDRDSQSNLAGSQKSVRLFRSFHFASRKCDRRVEEFAEFGFGLRSVPGEFRGLTRVAELMKCETRLCEYGLGLVDTDSAGVCHESDFDCYGESVSPRVRHSSLFPVNYL